jgi:hypothetical protein
MGIREPSSLTILSSMIQKIISRADLKILRILRALRRKNVGFQVELIENNTADEMEQIMNEFANRDYTDSDCFLCVIISHGEQEEGKGSFIVGIDEKYRITKELIYPFKSNPSLEGKPKVFLINACRGSETAQTLNMAWSAW